MLQASEHNFNGTRVCFFGNANETKNVIINLANRRYRVPAWPVSILPDCNTEAYNTAKVNVMYFT